MAFAFLAVEHVLTFITPMEKNPYSAVGSTIRDALIWLPAIGVVLVLFTISALHFSPSKRKQSPIVRGLATNPPLWCGLILLGLALYFLVALVSFAVFLASTAEDPAWSSVAHSWPNDYAGAQRKELNWDLWLAYVATSFWLVVYAAVTLCIRQIIKREAQNRRVHSLIARLLRSVRPERKFERGASGGG
jgi:hypothetical protein